MWFFLALLSAVLGGVRRTGEKRLLSSINHFTLGWAVQIFSLPIIIVAMVITGAFINPLQLSWNFWLPLLVVVLVFYPVNTWLFYRALNLGELSKVLPVQSLIPVLSLGIAWVALGEIPTIVASIGVLIICIGLYVLNLKGRALHNPLQPFMEDKSTLYMLGSTLTIAIVGPLQKVAIGASSPLFFTAASTAGAAVVLFAIAKFFKKDTLPLAQNWRMLTGVGLLQGAAYGSYMLALSMGPIAYVDAVKSGGLLIGALTGIVFLHEKVTRIKLIAFVLLAIGLSVLAINK